ncbi:MAG: TatD family hydrolase [Deltaproteobacteria bacterium]|nr:TatD family hydrolase [Candidatus Anaeroferrophillus wilburensis]MBN2888150.1 TatD family hydrolase [Deltaproteobacteria bacterium]
MDELFDSHCHLTDEPLIGQLDEVLSRAQNNLVTRIMVPGYDLTSSMAAAKLAQNHAEISFATGIHPGWVTEDVFPLIELEAIIRRFQPSAIGEIGLDFALDDHDPLAQGKALEAQLELARIFRLPVIIHCRKAFQPLYDQLRQFPEVIGILHAFNGGPAMGEKFLELGYYLAFGGGITRPNTRKIRKTALMVPEDRVILETDAPYIGSHTVAKGEIEPCHLQEIAKAFGQLRGWDMAETARRTTANAKRLFAVL